MFLPSDHQCSFLFFPFPPPTPDVVFFIYLYQRWIYRVDLTRVNEFGISGEAQPSPTTQSTTQQDGVLALPASGPLDAITEGPANGASPAVTDGAASQDSAAGLPDGVPPPPPSKTAEEKKKD